MEVRMSAEFEQRCLETLNKSSGDDIFADYAEYLRKEDRHDEAIIICMRGLSANPLCHRGRLALAHLYHDKGFLPFALREVKDLLEMLPSNISIRRLLELMTEEEQGGLQESRELSEEKETESAETTIAATEFDIDDFEQ